MGSRGTVVSPGSAVSCRGGMGVAGDLQVKHWVTSHHHKQEWAVPNFRAQGQFWKSAL